MNQLDEIGLSKLETLKLKKDLLQIFKDLETAAWAYLI